MIADHTIGTSPKIPMSTTAGATNSHPATWSEPSARRAVDPGASITAGRPGRSLHGDGEDGVGLLSRLVQGRLGVCLAEQHGDDGLAQRLGDLGVLRDRRARLDGVVHVVDEGAHARVLLQVGLVLGQLRLGLAQRQGAHLEVVGHVLLGGREPLDELPRGLHARVAVVEQHPVVWSGDRLVVHEGRHDLDADVDVGERRQVPRTGDLHADPARVEDARGLGVGDVDVDRLVDGGHVAEHRQGLHARPAS